MPTSLVKLVTNLPECFLSTNLVSAFIREENMSTWMSFLTSSDTFIIITLAKYKDNPLTENAKTIKPGIRYKNFLSWLINNCLIAGSNKYATEEVLPANSIVKKTEIRIFFMYLFV